MKKRILSIFLAVFVLLAALPFGTVMAEEIETETENNNSFVAEITLSEPDFPKTVTTYKVANNFPTEPYTFSSQTKEGNGWDKGVIDAPADYAILSSNNGNATCVVTEGQVKYTAEVAGGTFNAMLLFKSVPTADTNYLAIHVDATGLSAKEYCELSISNQKQQLYAMAGSTYYFMPDATVENPYPELETRTTTGEFDESVWKDRFWINTGDVGTLYIPETLFANGINYNKFSDDVASWNGDFSVLIPNEWRLSNGNRNLTSIRFNFKDGFPNAKQNEDGTVVKDSIIFGEMNWVANVPFSLDYNAEYIAEDFSDAENVIYSYWNGSNHTMSADNFEIADGVWKHNITADNWTDENSTFRYGHTLNLGYPVNSAFEALQFDVDFSDISYNPELQITYNVKNTNVSRNDYVRRFAVANGDVYAVWENGAVDTISVANNEWAWISLPKGFKGTVVIPFASLRTMSKDGYHTYDGSSVDLFKVDDINDFGLTIDIRNIPYENKGKVVTYDNFGYLTKIKPVLENGTVFSAETPVETETKITEEINTIDAWVKIPAGTAAGTILTNKYRKKENNAFVDSIILKMNAAGNPVLYLSDGDGKAVDFEVTNVDLRNDKWTHIAFAKSETAVNCYINGLFVASAEVPEGFGEVKSYHTLTIGHYIHDELGSATFGGEVANLKLWNKALTSSEILNSAINEATCTDGLISAWTLNGENGFTDIAGNYDLVVYDLYTTAEDEAYAEYSAMPEDGYTFAVLPDTQIAAQREAVTGDSDGFSKMYQWLIDNKDALNLKFAMGVGDITNKDSAEEYTLAKENFDKLADAGVSWSIVGGNHDFKGGSVAPNDTTNLNTYFPASEISTYSWFGGFMDENKIDNAYYYVTVNGTKYMILNLMCEPYDNVVEWANQVCAKNKDCKVIVVTHEYLNGDAKFRTTGYCSYEGRNNHGIQLWNKLISRHENIIMAIGGHVSVPDIQYREDLGVNGNKVISVLVDGQALDWGNSHNLLMLLKFSKDGSKVTFNYYSPTQGAYLDRNNQFTLDVGGVTSDEPVPDAPVTNFTYSKYHSGEVIREYEWFKNSTTLISAFSANKHSAVNSTNFSWYNNMLKFTAAEKFNIDPSTVTEESEGTPYDKDQIEISFYSLPNVVNKNQKAISFYVDLSGAKKKSYIKIAYNNGNKSYQAAAGGVLYLVDEDGNITEKAITSNWATLEVPAGFKGTVVIPFTSFCSDWGNGEFADDTTMLSDTQNNNAYLMLRMMEARAGDEYLFNNITYLEEYENTDLVTLRKGLMDAENGEDIDINGDTFVDVRDIVRLKKILADTFVK